MLIIITSECKKIMCGISGIVNFEKKPNINLAKKINKSIQHRGPDHNGTWSNNFCVHSIARLAIIDLNERANQPYLSNNKKISIVYNGEIYNFKELKEKYFSSKKFKTKSDGEVLLYLYEKLGIEFINLIKGMFAISIADANIKKHFLIRDRFGIKPLFYYYNKFNKELIFASEIQAIMQDKRVQRSENFNETYRYVCNDLINASDETWFKNIHQLKPASFLEISKDSFKIIKYYKLEDKINEDTELNAKNFKFYSEEIEDKLLQSYKEHSVFDVNAGIHCSGGADSALLAALCKHSNQKLKTFTFDYNEKKFSEAKEAKYISKWASLENYTSILEEKDLIDYYFKVLNIQQGPFSSLRVLSQHHLYETHREKAKVIFDGSGGDEISAGYGYQRIAWYLDSLGLKNLNKEMCIKILKKKKDIKVNKNVLGSLNRIYDIGGSTSDGSNYYDKSLINKDFLKIGNKNFAITKPFKSILRNTQYADIYYFKLPRSLKYTDLASMRQSVETRLPLLDHKLVEKCIEMPNKYKIIEGNQRAIFKNFIKKKFKNYKLENKKSIMDPQNIWLKNQFKPLMNDMLNSKSFKESNIFNHKKVNSYYKKFLAEKKHTNSYFLLTILNTFIMHQKIINQKVI